MSIDRNTVLKVAKLARLEVPEQDIDRRQREMSGILGWIDQLQSVDTSGVEPLANVANITLKQREDVVTDGNCREAVLANAPDSFGGFFAVPKIVE